MRNCVKLFLLILFILPLQFLVAGSKSETRNPKDFPNSEYIAVETVSLITLENDYKHSVGLGATFSKDVFAIKGALGMDVTMPKFNSGSLCLQFKLFETHTVTGTLENVLYPIKTYQTFWVAGGYTVLYDLNGPMIIFGLTMMPHLIDSHGIVFDFTYGFIFYDDFPASFMGMSVGYAHSYSNKKE